MKKEIKGNNQVGKGSKRRIENFNKLQSNWELINWKTNNKKDKILICITKTKEKQKKVMM